MNRRQFSAAVSSLAALSSGRSRADETRADSAGRPDRFGDPLPPHAVARLGTIRLWDDSGTWSRGGIAWSPDGTVFATGGIDPPVTFWDPATGRVVRQLGKKPKNFESGGSFNHPLTFSPDGKTLAVARREGVIERWDLASGRALAPLSGHGEIINGIVYSGDGRTLASGDGDGLILIRDAATGDVRHRLLTTSKHPPLPNFLVGIALSHDGSLLVSCGQWRSLQVWDAIDGRLKESLAWTDSYIVKCNSIALSPDGKTVAVGGSYRINVWDARTGRFRFVLNEQHNQQFTAEDAEGMDKQAGVFAALAFTPDGTTLASASMSGSIDLWDPIAGGERLPPEDHWGKTLAVGSRVARFDWRGAQVQEVAISPDGRTLAATAWGGLIRLWDLPTKRERIRAGGHHGPVAKLAFAADGRTLVSAGEDGVCISDPATGEMLKRVAILPQVCAVWAISPDGKFLAYQGLRSERFTNLVDLASGRVVRRIDQPLADAETTTLSFADDGKTLIFGISHLDDQYSMVLVDWTTGAEIRRFPQVKSGYFDELLLASDGRTLASLGFTGVILYDVATGRVRHWIELADKNTDNTTQKFRSFALAPGSAMLATTDEGGLIRFWNIVQGQEIRRIPAGLGWYDSLITYSPDGKVIASASGWRYGGNSPTIIQLWDVASGLELVRFDGLPATTTALAFSPDGRRLASGSRDTTVLTWDVAAWTS